MQRHLAAVLAVISVPLTVWLAGGPANARPWEPPPDTIVDVRGDSDNGFTLTHHDGTVLFPPTESEETAECEGYGTWREKIICRTEVRVWNDAWTQMRRSLRWARQAG